VSDAKGDMPFLDHLEELRRRILWSVAAVVIGSGLGLWAVFQLDIIGLLNAPLFDVLAELNRPDFTGLLATGRLAFLDLTEPFFFMLRVGVLIGVVLASPVIGYQAWCFLSPALKEKERRWIMPSMTLGVVLFSLGVAMAYFIALPMTIRFLLLVGAEWFTPALTAGYYFAMVIKLLLAFGLAFELPVVVMLLTAVGLITPAFLRAKRRHATVVMCLVGAMVTPGDGPLVMLLMLGPLLLLYELGIVLSGLVSRTRGEALDEAGPPAGSIAFMVALAAWRGRMESRRALQPQ